MDMSAILRRVEKLLAIAKDSRANPAEAAAAASQAEKIMRKFNLDHADILTREVREGSADFATADVYAAMKRGKHEHKASKKSPLWSGWLAIRVAKINDCQTRYVYPEGRPHVRFYGIRSDVQVAAWMYDYLVSQMVQSVRAWQAVAKRTKGESDSYRKAFVLTVCQKLRDIEKEREQEAAATSDGRALVLMDAKRQALAKHFGEENYKPGRTIELSNFNAAAAGARDGAKVDVGRRAVGNTAAAPTLALGG